MDLKRLGEVVREVLRYQLGFCTHNGISATCQKVGLPIPDPAKTKAERSAEAIEGISDDQAEGLSNQLLSAFPIRAADRNALQDALWADAGYPEIPKRTRREIAETLGHSDLFIDARHFDALLTDLWVLGDDPIQAVSTILGLPDRSLRGEIEQHVHRNPDWSGVELFDNLSAFEASDHRFALFLEGLASPDVRPNEDEQRRFVEQVNGPLKKQGLELQETGSEGGYPTFEVVSVHATPRGRPKNLIFASSIKPDLRFRDAIDNDIEIVTGADQVLIYDRPIGHDGLRWADLQSWWKDSQKFDDDDRAKKTLYRRLRASLPDSSPPQMALFDGFYNGFKTDSLHLPALLPEVWLHWDPKTIRMRGRDALLHSRMDFLLLLPNNVRAVVEVDGQQHYSENGRADPRRYARMVEADREMRLSGYEVYRFGASQLMEEQAPATVFGFFVRLFRLHGVIR
ncbi:hypothetical protein AB7849_17430 [Rhodanobacter sp. 115]|uniref:AbiJ-related protein n=1 Tax=Rhodanobacter sp. FW021-MT20 TaxID=1162282 RepID=UPI000260DF7C|nr:hypothetical protein [Rhodanobacter sp. 115]EIL90895.1 hypothetical protein UU5_14533 [Rhodanobacter sp. 115]